MKTLSHYLNGQLSTGQSQRTAPVYNPATGEQSAQVALATADETRDAVRIADEAFAAWSKTSPDQKSVV